ncbi:MAG: anion permease [Clostridiales bacterium]|nr:anion permease [Clostridiales bacterium]
MNKVMAFFKKDPVLPISGILAVISCFIIPPDKEYSGYINWRVLAILGGLMLVVGALSNLSAFDHMTSVILSKVRSQRKASLMLIILSFFLSMIMTNDVTLVTLVPFALITLTPFKDDKGLMYTLILMTCAANLGSMLTPIGNPQNPFIYTNYNMTLGHFVMLMLPYTGLSLAMIIGLCFILIGEGKASPDIKVSARPSTLKTLIYIALMLVAIVCVTGYLHYLIMLAIICVAMLILDRKAFLKVDYSLLLTFIFFFVLSGNIGRIESIHNSITGIASANPVLAAIILSQVISNVPCALLLSAFVSDGDLLAIGTNLGGLGTLIASMASLITYKIYSQNKSSGRYIAAFTVINVIMLAVLYLTSIILR